MTRREIQAEATRAQIVSSARELFLARGYVGTSISAVADLAGVSVQTIYNSVGNKAALLAAVLDQAASGPGAPRPMAEFLAERSQFGSTLSALAALLAEWFLEVNARTAEVTALIRQAAASYPEVAALELERSRRRLANYETVAAIARARGGLTGGMSDAQAAAAIWSLGHPQAYRTLVLEGEWAAADYTQWLHSALHSALA